MIPLNGFTSKSYLALIHNADSQSVFRQRVKWADVKDAASDLGLWGHLIITAIGLTPTQPLSTCKLTRFRSTSCSTHLFRCFSFRFAYRYQILPLQRFCCKCPDGAPLCDAMHYYGSFHPALRQGTRARVTWGLRRCISLQHTLFLEA